MEGFVRISKYAGMREDLVQAGGGNSSFKMAPDRMAVKASGFQLADVTETEGYALVNPEMIRKAFLSKSPEEIDDEMSRSVLKDAFISGNRPSIETFLHAISGKYTLHTHPTVVNALTCRKNGAEILRELFPQALIVPYATPGTELAKAYFKAYCERAVSDNEIFDTVFLMNHGLVVSAENADTVIEKTEEVLNVIEKYLNVNYESYHKLTRLWKLFDGKIVWKVNDVNVLREFTKCSRLWQYAFCPDCVVFMGKKCLTLSDSCTSEEVEKFRNEFGMPVVVSFDGELYLVADSVKKAMEIQSVLSFSAQVMSMNEGEECVFLSDREQNFLLDWDAEKYRKQMK